jgi:hypothetical protein
MSSTTTPTHEIGSVVSYEDIDNPPTTYVVIGAEPGKFFTTYRLRNIETFAIAKHVMRGAGWKVVAA